MNNTQRPENQIVRTRLSLPPERKINARDFHNGQAEIYRIEVCYWDSAGANSTNAFDVPLGQMRHIASDPVARRVAEF
jgi:hypothetical protein